KSWELLMAKIPSLTCNGCAAHTINLLLKDMFGMELMSDVFKKAVLVTKFVRKRAALLYRFRALQRNVVRNEDVLRELFSNHEFLARYGDAAAKLNRVESILADSMFWVNARAVIRLVNPIIQALGALEKDGC
ncbi:hypothetical protein PHYSODRAFT_387357, partial [Phytophthora sojae]